MSPASSAKPKRADAPAKTRYGGAADVDHAADLYSQGWTLRQIGAELGVTATTVSHQLRRAGVTVRRGGASVHPAFTQQILELRDQGLTWPEIADLADALDENLAIGVRAALTDHLGRAPTGLS